MSLNSRGSPWSDAIRHAIHATMPISSEWVGNVIAYDHDACWSGGQKRWAVLLQDGDDSLETHPKEKVSWQPLIESEMCVCISASVILKNQSVTLPEGELLSTYIHGLHQLRRFNLKQYGQEQLFTCYFFISRDSCYGEGKISHCCSKFACAKLILFFVFTNLKNTP